MIGATVFYFSKIKKYPMCLGNISGDFSANNVKKKTELNGRVYDFSVDYKTFDTNNIIDIHKYLMKKHMKYIKTYKNI